MTEIAQALEPVAIISKSENGIAFLDPNKVIVKLEGNTIGCISRMSINISEDVPVIYATLRVFTRTFTYAVESIGKDDEDSNNVVFNLMRCDGTDKDTCEDIKKYISQFVGTKL